MPDPLPSQPGNIFCPTHVAGELSRVRERIRVATDVAHGRRALPRGERLPDLAAFCRRERELIERFAVLQGNVVT